MKTATPTGAAERQEEAALWAWAIDAVPELASWSGDPLGQLRGGIVTNPGRENWRSRGEQPRRSCKFKKEESSVQRSGATPLPLLMALPRREFKQTLKSVTARNLRNAIVIMYAEENYACCCKVYGILLCDATPG